MPVGFFPHPQSIIWHMLTPLMPTTAYISFIFPRISYNLYNFQNLGMRTVLSPRQNGHPNHRSKINELRNQPVTAYFCGSHGQAKYLPLWFSRTCALINVELPWFKTIFVNDQGPIQLMSFIPLSLRINFQGLRCRYSVVIFFVGFSVRSSFPRHRQKRGQAKLPERTRCWSSGLLCSLQPRREGWNQDDASQRLQHNIPPVATQTTTPGENRYV